MNDLLDIEIVELGREVPGRPCGPPASDPAAIDVEHRSPAPAQLYFATLAEDPEPMSRGNDGRREGRQIV